MTIYVCDMSAYVSVTVTCDKHCVCWVIAFVHVTVYEKCLKGAPACITKPGFVSITVCEILVLFECLCAVCVEVTGPRYNYVTVLMYMRIAHAV